ncbi:MAG: trigger factor [Halobacteriovoraceae bacterium]|nr:trigger factor [Halobacteriovoraceae bacterium]|tara:strand:+ start:3027 stop:4313 length:1287 start_codon:yes stop_codon:yes gene_type:complete
MSYSVETVNGCTKKLIFNFEDVNLENQIQAALKEKQKNANLKGFRKGKAPLDFVKQIYGAQVENDALYRFVSEEFYKAVQSEDFRAIGYPTFGNTKRDENNVSFEATVEIFPEVELKDYKDYEFTKESAEVTEEDVKALKDRYLEPKSEMVEVKDEDAKLEKGMFAVFNFEGEKEDGSKPDNMKAEEFLLEIGSGQFIPGFEDGMMGLKKGDKKTIELTFPSDYHETDLRDAKVKFHVDVLELKEKKIPELTDELAKEFGFESVEDFNTKNKERLEQQKSREVSQKLHEDILKKFVEENSFDVPQTLIEQQKQSVREDLGANLKSQGFDEKMVETYFSKWDDDIAAKAEFQVRSGLILDKLAKKYEVEATDADLDKKIDEMAAQSGMEKEQLASYYTSNENIKSNLMYAIREEKTFDQLISDMKVKNA